MLRRQSEVPLFDLLPPVSANVEMVFPEILSQHMAFLNLVAECLTLAPPSPYSRLVDDAVVVRHGARYTSGIVPIRNPRPGSFRLMEVGRYRYVSSRSEAVIDLAGQGDICDFLTLHLSHVDSADAADLTEARARTLALLAECKLKNGRCRAMAA